MTLEDLKIIVIENYEKLNKLKKDQFAKNLNEGFSQKNLIKYQIFDSSELAFLWIYEIINDFELVGDFDYFEFLKNNYCFFSN